MTLTGLFVPLITPFTTDGELALDALERHAHRVLDDGATGIVALGTTAEPATLSAEEHRRVLDVCLRVCSERGAPLIAGAGTNSTTGSLAALHALDERITAALTVVPYYTRPSEAGVLAHFRRLAAGPVPLIVYNIPYRTSRTLGLDTVLELADIPGIAGFKHAVGAIDDTTIAMMGRLAAEVSVLAGDDLYAAPLLALGAHGAILACANLATSAYAELVRGWRDGPIDAARILGHRLSGVAEAVFAEPNPVVIKSVLAAQGHIPSSTVRLPLLPASAAATAAALRALDAVDIRCGLRS
ncbi:4-hydroxy-tetrahydrodipicolinate synthase [Nocardia cyriacigeorgica]|uniref:4-hydroxy-tetrahydrodipicolinate synthase n=1 Tax=Nocardia cyriacigeorgica TaxID=135487 RepID=UPI0018937C63|nr:4-hydroxy-tetrahydrodipicolinate synthase [Nocardia cyriacigeorgica]MBF6440197.1 4-hydroxy-tetrahydrodipicolinate synthase [Nocardia cyriacigeorgica]